jgi:hypothetical protein
VGGDLVAPHRLKGLTVSCRTTCPWVGGRVCGGGGDLVEPHRFKDVRVSCTAACTCGREVGVGGITAQLVCIEACCPKDKYPNLVELHSRGPQ